MSYDGTQAGQAGPRTIMSPWAKFIITALPCKSICRLSVDISFDI